MANGNPRRPGFYEVPDEACGPNTIYHTSRGRLTAT